METLRRAIIEIESQLDAARAQVKQGGEYADPDWYHRATYAVKTKKQMYQRLQDELGVIKRKEKGTKGRVLGNCFIDVARRRLDEEVFSSILVEAQNEADACNGNGA
jgi:hypothetical protein